MCVLLGGGGRVLPGVYDEDTVPLPVSGTLHVCKSCVTNDDRNQY